MADLFTRRPEDVQNAAVLATVAGDLVAEPAQESPKQYGLKLRIKHRSPIGQSPAEDMAAIASPLEFELELDGKPLGGLIQKLEFSIGADDLVPVLKLEIVPMGLDIEIDSEAAKLLPGLVPAYCLVKPGIFPVQPLTGADEVKVKAALDQYRKTVLENLG